MSRKCLIYYGTIIATLIKDNYAWISEGSHMEEPVKIEGRDPLGKEPEFCCKQFEELWKKRYSVYFYSNSDAGQIEVRLRGTSYSGDPKMDFCPFCGAKIILVENLKLRAIKTTHTIESYYVEEAV